MLASVAEDNETMRERSESNEGFGEVAIEDKGLRRFSRGFLAVWVSGFALLASGNVLADASMDAAMDADSANQDLCANLYSKKVDIAAESLAKVAEVWQRVSEQYDRDKAPYLLFWRGVLAQCLGRNDAAITDLEEFSKSQAESTMFVDLVRQGKARLRRLGTAGKVGDGPSAEWLRRAAPIEVDASWGLGLGASHMVCTDYGAVGGRVENSSCKGGVNPNPATRAAFWPARIEGGIGLFPSRLFGLDLHVGGDFAAPNGMPDQYSPGKSFHVTLGPMFRVLSSVASGTRAGQIRIGLRGILAMSDLSPWAGNAKYSSTMGYLDAGAWNLLHLGGELAVRGAVELTRRQFLAVGASAGIFAPPGAWGRTRVRAPAAASLRVDLGALEEDPEDDVERIEEVEESPEPVHSTRFDLSARVGTFLVAETRPVAVGPWIGVAVHQLGLKFPDDKDDVWIGGDDADSAEDELRKVYSTERTEFVGLVGIEVRIHSEPRN